MELRWASDDDEITLRRLIRAALDKTAGNVNGTLELLRVHLGTGLIESVAFTRMMKDEDAQRHMGIAGLPTFYRLVNSLIATEGVSRADAIARVSERLQTDSELSAQHEAEVQGALAMAFAELVAEEAHKWNQDQSGS